MKEKIRDRQKNSSYPEIRVKRVRVNGFQLYNVLLIWISNDFGIDMYVRDYLNNFSVLL